MALARVSPSSAAHGAKQAVAAAGVSAGLIDMHTIKPLDEAAVLKAAHTSRIVLTVEEHNILGGLGSAVAEVMAENPGKARRQHSTNLGRAGRSHKYRADPKFRARPAPLVPRKTP